MTNEQEHPHRRHDDLPELEGTLATTEDPLLVRRLLKEYERKVMEDIFDKALDSWLDKKFTAFGKWSVTGICALAFSAFAYFYVHTGGFK